MKPGRYKAVSDLDDFDLSYEHDGRPLRRHEWHEAAYAKQGWATIFACYRDWTAKGWSVKRYRIVRLRRLAGMWRVISHINLKSPHLRGLAHAMTRATVEEEFHDVG